MMNMEHEHIRLLSLEADAIFGLEPAASPPTPSSSSSVTSSSSSPTQPRHRILRDPKLHALLIWSRHSVVTALSPALSAQLAAAPDSVASQAAASIVDLALFRVQMSSSLGMVPACLVHLQDALGLPTGAIAGGPTWIVPDAVRTGALPHSSPPGVKIYTSTHEEDRRVMARLERPRSWGADEWAQLVAATGPDAPWAMAVYHDEESAEDQVGAQIACICHTPARNAQVVEAGIWTREDMRGKGLAPATVAAWATLHPPEITTLFYSTSKENTASQAVARKLGLHEFGYIWKLLVV